MALMSSLKVTRFGCRFLLLHLFHERPSLLKIVIFQMSLDESVERDNISHSCILCLLHPLLCSTQITAFDASIEDSVVDDTVEIYAAFLQGFKNTHGTLEVAFCCTVTDHCNVFCDIRW